MSIGDRGCRLPRGYAAAVARIIAPLSVEDGAARLADALALLHELVHQHAGRLALEPRLEIKGLLAAHLHDDALGVTALRRRLVELGRPEDPGGPAPALASLPGGAAGRQAYLEAAYGSVKPRLAAALRDHLDALDPVADEPGLRLIAELAHRQERHVVELPVGAVRRFEGTPDAPRAVLPSVDAPARDAYVGVASNPQAADDLHGRMHAAVCAAEVAGRTLHEHPGQPWELHADLARLAWDGMRHAAVLDRAMAGQGRQWGAEPVDLRPFTAAYGATDLAGRLAALAVAAEAEAAGGHEPPPGLSDAVAGLLRADAAYHARTCARWGRRLLEGNDGAWYEHVRAARAARDGGVGHTAVR
jgi:hypothetical protein